MSEDIYKTLNDIYTPIYTKAKSILSTISTYNYEGKLSWHNMHYVRQEDHFIKEIFPIPVIIIANLCDIGIDIHSIFIEFTLDREGALVFDYDNIIKNYKFEVYGSEDYLEDFYDTGMNASDIKTKISLSNEDKIHITIYANLEVNEIDIINIIRLFENE